MLKALYQQESAQSAQSAAHQLAHAAVVVGVPVAAVLEKGPACLLKQGSQSGAGEGMDLRAADLVDGFAEVFADMKAVKDMERDWQGFGDDVFLCRYVFDRNRSQPGVVGRANWASRKRQNQRHQRHVIVAAADYPRADRRAAA